MGSLAAHRGDWPEASNLFHPFSHSAPSSSLTPSCSLMLTHFMSHSYPSWSVPPFLCGSLCNQPLPSFFFVSTPPSPTRPSHLTPAVFPFSSFFCCPPHVSGRSCEALCCLPNTRPSTSTWESWLLQKWELAHILCYVTVKTIQKLYDLRLLKWATVVISFHIRSN